jgi:hypothetical protein
MRRRRRYYGGAVSLDLGGLLDFRRSVNTQDVLIGLAIGIGGAAAAGYGLKYAREKNMATFLNAPAAGTDWIQMGVPVIGGAMAGAAAFYGRKRRNRSAAYANLIGAIGAGAAIVLWPKVAKAAGLPLAGVVGLDLPWGGMLVDDNASEQYQGLLVNDYPMRGYADQPALGRLAAASLDEGEDYRELGHLAQFSDFRAWAG